MERRPGRTWRQITTSEPASFAREVAVAASHHRLTGRASEVAFWWVFTLFPALLVLAAVLGLLDQVIGTSAAVDVRDEIIRVVADVTGSRDNEAVVQVRELFGRGGASLLTFGVLVALWSTSRSFTALVYTLDEVYGVEEERGWIEVRALGVLLALGTIAAGAVALALLVVGPLLGRGPSSGEGSDVLATTWAWLRLPFAAVVLVVFHTTIYRLAPGQSSTWRAQLPGGVATSVAWCVASLGFALYLDVAGGTSFVVGVLGAALTMMLWFYLLAIGMMVGGEVNVVVAARRARSQGATAELR